MESQNHRSGPVASDIKTFRLVLTAPIRHYSPERVPLIHGATGQRHRPRLASPRHGNSTPPRIAPSRPHCLIPLSRGCGWTDVLCRRCCGETADALHAGSRGLLLSGRMGTASHLIWPSLMAVSRHRWFSRILRCRSPSREGTPANVFVPLDIRLSRNSERKMRNPSHFLNTPNPESYKKVL